MLQKWGLEARVIAWDEFGFDMGKYVALSNDEDQGGSTEGDDMNHDTNKLNVSPPKAPVAIPLVDYSSGSESDEMDEDLAKPDGNREFDGDTLEPISPHRMGDGGAISSVHLLWICKQGQLWRSHAFKA